MVAIRDIEQPCAELYAPAYGDGCGVYVGKVTSYAQWLDVRRQVAEEGATGYYALFNGEKVMLDRNGNEDHIPYGWFGEIEVKLLLGLV